MKRERKEKKRKAVNRMTNKRDRNGRHKKMKAFF
jgi:hypothetical protein